jgi:hypothetical protein
MKIVESVPVTEDAIKKHKAHGVRTVKDIIESAELGSLPESLLYEMEDYLFEKVFYLKFQKDFYSKYSLTLEQKYFLTTYYFYIYCVSDIDLKERAEDMAIFKEICRSIGYESEEIQDPDFRKRFYYFVNQPRKLTYTERILMHKTRKDFKTSPEREEFRKKRDF